MKKIKVLVVVLLIAAGFGLVSRSLLNIQRWRCDVCMTYNGTTLCRKASGANKDEALRTAIDTACSPMTAGMGESIACTNTPPTSTTCAEK